MSCCWFWFLGDQQKQGWRPESVGSWKGSNTNEEGSNTELAEPLEFDSARYTSMSPIVEALLDGSTALVRGDWLATWSTTGLPLPSREDLPAGALWEPGELEVGSEKRHTLIDGSWTDVHVVAVSHCWMTPNHPDPDAVQARALGRAINVFHASFDDHVNTAILFDWCSYFQGSGNSETSVAVQRRLRHASLWFASEVTWVWCLQSVAVGLPSAARGWTMFEQTVAQVHHRTTNLDLSRFVEGECWSRVRQICTTVQQPPVHPNKMADLLEVSQDGAFDVFSAVPEDRHTISRLYQKVFHELMSAVETLNYSGLQWGDASCEVLSRVLPECTRLRELHLWDNDIGDEGAALLAGVLPQCKNLQSLNLYGNSVGDRGALALAVSLVATQRPACLNLLFNSLTHQGKRSVSEVWRQMPQDDTGTFLGV